MQGVSSVRVDSATTSQQATLTQFDFSLTAGTVMSRGGTAYCDQILQLAASRARSHRSQKKEFAIEVQDTLYLTLS
jgi:hypothetical protein